jgi:hypothetical protein
MPAMRRLAVVVLLLVGCEQVLGIHNPEVGSGVADARKDAPSIDGHPDAPSNDCAVIPTWGSATSYAAQGALSFAVGDVNQDDIVDVVVAFGSDTEVYFGRGSGLLDAPRALTPGSPAPATNIILADVNGDHHDDVIAWTSFDNGGEISVYLQTSPGVFAAPETITFPLSEVYFANFNGFTAPDLLVRNGETIQAYTNAGSGSFVAGAVVATDAFAAGISDIDGDGFADVVYADSTAQIHIAFNEAGSGFASPISVGTTNQIAAIDGLFSSSTTLRDLVLFPSNGSAGALFTQTAPRSFTETEDMAVVLSGVGGVGSSPDLNGDGRHDLVIGGDFAVQCTGSAGTFFPDQAGQTAPQIPGWINGTLIDQPVTQIVDMNADGKPDIVTFDSLVAGTGANLLEVSLQ